MMRAKTALASLSLLLTLSLSGCGSDSALTDYTSQMNTFYDAFSSGTLALEQIDPSSETAQEELLSGLDELTALTDSLADISVPKRYADAGIDELAAQAAEHMQEADSLYHEACSAETFDQERASAAQEHYQRAMKRIHKCFGGGRFRCGKKPGIRCSQHHAVQLFHGDHRSQRRTSAENRRAAGTGRV